MTEKLQHLLNGGKLETLSGALVTFLGIEVEFTDETIGSFDLAKLDTCEIYTSPEEEEIKQLKLQVKNLEMKLDEIYNPSKTKVHPGGAKIRIHLNHNEVKEIEQIFMNKPNFDINLMASTYNVGHNVIRRIKSGDHAKTSGGYMATQITQQNNNSKG